MNFSKEQIAQALEKVKSYVTVSRTVLKDTKFINCDYKKDNTLPQVTEEWTTLDENMLFSKVDGHLWLHTHFKAPKVKKGYELYFSCKTSKHDNQWNATNPQGLIYINGVMTQGLDINHTEVLIEGEKEYDIYVYFYYGMLTQPSHISLELVTKSIIGKKLYYDLNIPYNSALLFEKDSGNYLNIMKHLRAAVNMLDFTNNQSPKYYKSAEKACEYLYRKFYKEICGNSEIEAFCIGHTHIDVAWLWTLAQTR